MVNWWLLTPGIIMAVPIVLAILGWLYIVIVDDTYVAIKNMFRDFKRRYGYTDITNWDVIHILFVRAWHQFTWLWLGLYALAAYSLIFFGTGYGR